MKKSKKSWKERIMWCLDIVTFIVLVIYATTTNIVVRRICNIEVLGTIIVHLVDAFIDD